MQKGRGISKYCGALAIVALLVVFASLLTNNKLFAATITDSGTVSVSGTVYGPPPTTPAVITSPSNGHHFTDSPINVSGTCGPNLIVKIFKNNIFAGSTVCSVGGNFSISVDLLYGKTDLRARNYDFQDQAGPESAIVTVYYDVSTVTIGPTTVETHVNQVPSDASKTNIISQLIVKTDITYQGVAPNVDFEWPIEVFGGAPPYAIGVDWGDGTNTLISRKDSGVFNISHKYTQNGNYTIVINVTDVMGRKGYLQLSALASTQLSVVRQQSNYSVRDYAKRDYAKWIIAINVLLVSSGLAYWLGRHKGRPENKQKIDK